MEFARRDEFAPLLFMDYIRDNGRDPQRKACASVEIF